jgi:hypothetical protein
MLTLSQSQADGMAQQDKSDFDAKLRAAITKAQTDLGRPAPSDDDLTGFIAAGMATCKMAGFTKQCHIAEFMVLQASQNASADGGQLSPAAQETLIGHYDTPQAKLDALAAQTENPKAAAKASEAAKEFPPMEPGQLVQPCPLTRLDYWLEIELFDEADKPVPGEPFHVKFPNGQEVKGKLNGDGFARFADLAQAGTAQVCFPEQPGGAWMPVTA